MSERTNGEHRTKDKNRTEQKKQNEKKRKCTNNDRNEGKGKRKKNTNNDDAQNTAMLPLNGSVSAKKKKRVPTLPNWCPTSHFSHLFFAISLTCCTHLCNLGPGYFCPHRLAIIISLVLRCLPACSALHCMVTGRVCLYSCRVSVCVCASYFCLHCSMECVHAQRHSHNRREIHWFVRKRTRTSMSEIINYTYASNT